MEIDSELRNLIKQKDKLRRKAQKLRILTIGNNLKTFVAI